MIFILLIDLISIKAEKTERYVRAKWLHTYSDVTIIKKTDEEPLFEQLKKYDRVRTFFHHLRHPLESFVHNVNLTLYVTIPIAVLYMVLVWTRVSHYQNFEILIRIVDSHFVIALLIVLIPYAIFYELWSRKVLGIQALIPDFLERMSGINQVGLTIVQAIAIMVNTNLGLLVTDPEDQAGHGLGSELHGGADAVRATRKHPLYRTYRYAHHQGQRDERADRRSPVYRIQ